MAIATVRDRHRRLQDIWSAIRLLSQASRQGSFDSFSSLLEKIIDDSLRDELAYHIAWQVDPQEMAWMATGQNAWMYNYPWRWYFLADRFLRRNGIREMTFTNVFGGVNARINAMLAGADYELLLMQPSHQEIELIAA